MVDQNTINLNLNLNKELLQDTKRRLKLDDSLFFDRQNDKHHSVPIYNHNENNESIKNLRESRYKKYQSRLKELSE